MRALLQLERTIAELRPLEPAFVSVTWGAGGSTREKTIDIVSRIKRETGIEAMAHLTCVGATREEIGAILERLTAAGVENVLALRGDPPKGQSTFHRGRGRIPLCQRTDCFHSASARRRVCASAAPLIRKSIRNAAIRRSI